MELGVSPIATGSNQDLPPAAHEPFEDGIRLAARTVGQLHLEDGNIPAAWAYYRMLGETGPIAAALEAHQLSDDQDNQPLIDIAFHQGVHPTRGFDWILKRYGLCSAITTMGGGQLPFSADVKNHCIKQLIHSLHQELVIRLKAEIERQQNFVPTATTVKDLIAGRDFLFADEAYYIDMSHLSAVVQMAIQLDPCPELALARDLCAYGQKLSPRFTYPTDPPFENQYKDYDVFLSILTGEQVEEGLAHFRRKAEEADPDQIGTYPAQVLVNLLLKLGRPREALAISKKFLANEPADRLSCPTFVDLCQQTQSYGDLAEVARNQGNAVNFLAGLVAAGK